MVKKVIPFYQCAFYTILQVFNSIFNFAWEWACRNSNAGKLGIPGCSIALTPWINQITRLDSYFTSIFNLYNPICIKNEIAS